jgi:RimJ/RimL family protein N-acetyltransferase
MYSTTKTTKDGRTLIIREAEGRDAGVVLRYLDKISRETNFLTFGPGEFSLTEKEEFDYLEKCRRTDNCLYLLSLLEETLVGNLIFTAGGRPRTRHAGELSTSVLKKFWNIGIASALFDSLLEWAKTGNIIRKINLRVRSDNQRAIELYKHKGFLVEGTLKKELFINGNYYDNLWMGLEI